MDLARSRAQCYLVHDSHVPGCSSPLCLHAIPGEAANSGLLKHWTMTEDISMTQGTPTSNPWVSVSLCLPWLWASAIYFHDNESTGPLCISLTSCRSMLHLWNILAPLLELDCYYKSAECEESASVNFLKGIFRSHAPSNKWKSCCSWLRGTAAEKPYTRTAQVSPHPSL